MYYLELATLILDLVGVIFVSLFLFKIPDKIEFRCDQDYGTIIDLDAVANAINSTLPSPLVFSFMRWGLGLLVLSMILKFTSFFLTNCPA